MRIVATHGIAFSGNVIWAVISSSNHSCVWIFDGDDQPVRKIGGNGTSDGKFNSPYMG